MSFDRCIGYSIFNNAINGAVGAPGIQSSGIFTIGSNAFANVANKNLYPAAGSPLIGRGSSPQQAPLAYDFNGKARSSKAPTVGAYVNSIIQSDAMFIHLSILCRNIRPSQILVVRLQIISNVVLPPLSCLTIHSCRELLSLLINRHKFYRLMRKRQCGPVRLLGYRWPILMLSAVSYAVYATEIKEWRA